MTFSVALASIGTAIAEGAAAGSLASTVGGGLAAGTIGNTIGAGALMGSTLGGITSAATGQDVGEGVGMGALTGAIGGGLSAGLGALAPAASEAATATTEATKDLGTAGANAANKIIPASFEGLSNPTLTAGGENLLGQSASSFAPNYSSLSNGATDIVGSGLRGTSTAGALNDFLPSASTMGGNAAAGNSGISAINNRLMSDQLAPQFASQAPSTPAPSNMAERIGVYAKENPGTIGTIGSLAATPFVNGAFTPDQPEAPGLQYPNIDPNKFKYTAPQWQVHQPKYYADGGITDLDAGDGIPSVQMMAKGGISDLGSYSDGGQLLRGPGDGVSDDIPAQIGEKQPARLAEGEFVIPARIVSELGNGSTDAGAKRLYQMMDRINSGRAATAKKGKFAEDTKAYKHLPV